MIDWPARILAAADVRDGDRVLDVACGTGILARLADPLVGMKGSVVGVDINESMLNVARSKSNKIKWQKAPAEALPFPPLSFDRALCQFGLMFFEDPGQALSEMYRVTRPGGCISFAVWASLGEAPGYAVVAELLQELFGAEAAESVKAAFAWGDECRLKTLMDEAGIEAYTIQTIEGHARFDSIAAWMQTEIKGWTLADMIDEAGFARLAEAAQLRLAPFTFPDGSVEFDMPARIVSLQV